MVAGSIPGGVFGIFIDLSSARTTVLGSTQPLIEMINKNISGG
jgi:hypothetical protein